MLQHFDSPWPHVEIPDFLPQATQIASQWPTGGFQWLKHSDITKPDGTSLRRYQHLGRCFPEVAEWLLSPELGEAFRKALGVDEQPLYPIALLVEDSPGYRIRSHTDCAGKVITCQVYLAEDNEHIEQGVVLHDRSRQNRKQIPYRFNHAYAFKVTKGTWHRVERSRSRRRSIQLLYYSTPEPVI